MLNRRNLLKSATATARFDRRRAETEPSGAFTRELPIPATLRPTAVAPREQLEGPKTRSSRRWRRDRGG